MAKPELLIIVDEQDNAIGSAEKMLVHQTGKLHRAFSIFIFRMNNGVPQLLLQQRNKEKYHCGNLWTNTCCGHPVVGEELLTAAKRRLNEEMCFTTELFHLASFQYLATCNNGLIEHEIDHVCVGFYQAQIQQVNPAEVQAFRWLDFATLAVELQVSPEQFTPWFTKALAVVKQHQEFIEQQLLINKRN